MDLNEITPLILTYNESANLQDTLDRLRWAKKIVVIDSFSSDNTLAIASEFSQVEVHQRKFDHFANQCNFGFEKISTPWVLSLDADYKISPEFVDELRTLKAEQAGYRAKFRYAIFGKLLRSTLYPPRVVLYRVGQASYLRDGHAHRVQITGSTGDFSSPIIHDDRKPISVWFASQSNYANAEADKLLNAEGKLGWKDRIRRQIFIAPILTSLYCLFVRGLIFDGWAGLYYTAQRVHAELTLSVVLIDRRLRKS